MSEGRAVAARWAAPLAVCVLSPLVTLRHMILAGFAWVPGDAYDGRLNNYFLEHTWRWLVRQPIHARLWDLPIFFPAGKNAAAFSDLMLSFGPLYWPWRALGLPSDTAYQLWFLAVLALDALAAYLFLRRAVGLSPAVAAAGAWLVSGAASLRQQLSHAQLLPLFLLVGGLGAALGFVRAEDSRQRRQAVAALGACVVAQLYGGFYMGVFLLLALVALALVALVLGGARPRLLAALRVGWRDLAAAAGLAALLLVPWLVHYRAAHQLLRVGKSWSTVAEYVPAPATWAYMSPGAFLYGWTATTPPFSTLRSGWEHAVGVGFLTTLALLGAAVLARRRLAVQLAGGAALVVVLLTTSYAGHSPWRLLCAAVPPLVALRAISRVGLLLPLVAAVLIGSAVDAAPVGRARRLGLLLLGLCVLEQLGTATMIPRDVQRRAIADVASAVDRHARAFFVLVQRPRVADDVAYDAMFASTLVGIPTVNGQSGNLPPEWMPMALTAARRPGAVAEARARLDAWLGEQKVPVASVQQIVMRPSFRVERPRRLSGDRR